MHSFSTRTGQALIVAFCLWHMTAVTLYLVPSGWNGVGSTPIRSVRSLTDPYVLSFSQWQQWNIFSPDPLRRVSVFRVEATVGGETTPTVFDSEKLSLLRRAKELKVLYRLEDDWKSLVEPYLLTFCTRSADENIELQLLRTYSVLPADLDSLKRVSKKKLPAETGVLGSVRCP